MAVLEQELERAVQAAGCLLAVGGWGACREMMARMVVGGVLEELGRSVGLSVVTGAAPQRLPRSLEKTLPAALAEGGFVVRRSEPTAAACSAAGVDFVVGDAWLSAISPEATLWLVLMDAVLPRYWVIDEGGGHAR